MDFFTFPDGVCRRLLCDVSGFRAGEKVSEKEIVMVYIGSSTCGYSNDSSLPKLIDDAKIKLQRMAIRQGWSFSAIGLSIDWIPEQGFGAQLYLNKMPGINGTPQILVLGRQMREDESEELLIYHMAGLYRILNWVNQDISLPQDVLERFSSSGA